MKRGLTDHGRSSADEHRRVVLGLLRGPVLEAVRLEGDGVGVHESRGPLERLAVRDSDEEVRVHDRVLRVGTLVLLGLSDLLWEDQRGDEEERSFSDEERETGRKDDKRDLYRPSLRVDPIAP